MDKAEKVSVTVNSLLFQSTTVLFVFFLIFFRALMWLSCYCYLENLLIMIISLQNLKPLLGSQVSGLKKVDYLFAAIAWKIFSPIRAAMLHYLLPVTQLLETGRNIRLLANHVQNPNLIDANWFVLNWVICNKEITFGVGFSGFATVWNWLSSQGNGIKFDFGLWRWIENHFNISGVFPW